MEFVSDFYGYLQRNFTAVKFTAIKNNNGMKKFYNREQEMKQLHEMQRQSYEDYSRFVVLTGRR